MAEKNLNFEQVIERRGTDCLKYDFASKRGLPEGVLPLWVADMDFRISSYIQEALFEQVEHGIYGYTDTFDEYYQAVNNGLAIIMDTTFWKRKSLRLPVLYMRSVWRYRLLQDQVMPY